QTYDFTLVAKNKSGLAGTPQAATFNTLPPGTASAIPGRGAANLGVAVPLVVVLSSPPSDKAMFAARVSVRSQGGIPASSGTGLCGQYNVAATAGSVPVAPVWISDT